MRGLLVFNFVFFPLVGEGGICYTIGVVSAGYMPYVCFVFNITTGKCLEREGIDDKQVVQMGCGHHLLVAARGDGGSSDDKSCHWRNGDI